MLKIDDTEKLMIRRVCRPMCYTTLCCPSMSVQQVCPYFAECRAIAWGRKPIYHLPNEYQALWFQPWNLNKIPSKTNYPVLFKGERMKKTKKRAIKIEHGQSRRKFK